MNTNLKVCPKCGEHHKLTCKDRFKTFFDNKEFELIETLLPKDDPLNFVDKKKYTDQLTAARKLTGQNDAVLIATGKVQNIEVVVGAQDLDLLVAHLEQPPVKPLLQVLSMRLKIMYLTYFLVALADNACMKVQLH